MGAEQASVETSMEARIARLESDVVHLRTDVADIKVDVRSLRDKMDSMQTKLLDKFDGVNAKVDGVEQRLDVKIGDFRSQLDAKLDKLADSLTKAQIRSFGLYAALTAAMLGTMARGFGWI
jgi:predicted nuclease with TOPRIM domain